MIDPKNLPGARPGFWTKKRIAAVEAKAERAEFALAVEAPAPRLACREHLAAAIEEAAKLIGRDHVTVGIWPPPPSRQTAPGSFPLPAVAACEVCIEIEAESLVEASVEKRMNRR